MHCKSHLEKGGGVKLIWYNRDSISDQDMRQAKAVAERLLGKKEFDTPLLPFFSGATMQVPIMYGYSANHPNKAPLQTPVPPFDWGWEPAPQWAKDAKEDDRKREA
jgi:hypothetical protein